MKTVLITIVSTLCFGTSMLGQGFAPGGRGGGIPPVAILKALDANQDGKISAKEIKNAAAALKALDQNKDGKLSAAEMGWPPNFGRGGPGRGGRGGAVKPRRPNPDEIR